jgi:hypothetical protein
MRDETKFKEWMTTLGEIHDKHISELLSSVYWKILEPYSDDQCEKAFSRLIYEAKWFPKPAELIEILDGKRMDRPTQAWIETVNAVRRHGNYISICFHDPVIHAVIEFMGGWGATGEWMDDELKWKQREFEKLYPIMAGRGKNPKYLPGLCEIDNQAKGIEREPEIVMIDGAALPMIA